MKFRDIFKTILMAIIILVAVAGCSNNEPTIQWVEKAKKPIVCRYVGSYWDGGKEWTLIDADGNIFATGNVRINLPDTIKLLSNGN